MIGKKRKPWRRYFPQDWFSDPELRKCSLSAKGLWAEMLAIAWLSPVEGYLINSDGTPIDEPTLSKLVGEAPGNTRRALAELESHGVFSRDDRGVIYSRRIVRDVEESLRKSQNGRLGGNPALRQDNRLDNRLDNQEDNQEVCESGLPASAYASAYASASASSGGDARGGNAVKSDAGFDDFWAAWPKHWRKRSREQCRDKWRSKGLADRSDAVMAGLAACMASPDWHKNGGEFIPAPLVWLNQDRWDIDATGPEIAPTTRPKIDLSDPWGDKAKA